MSSSERPNRWIAMGAVGSLVACAGSVGDLVQNAEAAQGPITPAANVLTQGAATSYRFDIAEGSLGETIDAFQKVTGLRVTMTRQGFEMLPSPGIRGEYTAERALQQILVGDRHHVSIYRLRHSRARSSDPVDGDRREHFGAGNGRFFRQVHRVATGDSADDRSHPSDSPSGTGRDHSE